MKNPCYDRETKKDCENRCTGCSTICALWHEYVKNRDEQYAKIKKQKEQERNMKEYKMALCKRLKNR